MNEDNRPRLASKARLRFDRLSGRTMLLAPEKGLALNDTARAIVERCDGATSVADIVAAICVVSGAPRDEVLRDVAELLDALAARSLITGWSPEK